MMSESYSGQSVQRGGDERIQVLFLGRSNCSNSSKALSHLRNLGFKIQFVESQRRGESLPTLAESWSGDYIFSFRSLFILPKQLLNRARIAAINFHPGPTEYPGSGCVNFALYEGADTYGVTAHVMSEKVDHGQILDCWRFRIFQSDTVDSLVARTHTRLLELFRETCSGIMEAGAKYIADRLEASSGEGWRGAARKVSELDALQIIAPTATREEVERIIRATYTERFPPKILLHGYEFILKEPRALTLPDGSKMPQTRE